MMHVQLIDVSTSALGRLAEQLRRHPDVRHLDDLLLGEWGLSKSAAAVQAALAPFAPETWGPLLEVVLAERRRADKPAPEFVWTGPAPHHSRARRTRVLLEGMFRQARSEVLVAGYAFDHGRELFEHLHRAMVERDVTARFYINLKQERSPNGGPEAMSLEQVRAGAQEFLDENWPFGSPWPRLFVDKRLMTGECWASLHAKCAVVDAAHTLLTSANFTQRGQERNIEAGAVVHDETFAQTVLEQFNLSTLRGLFLEVKLPGKG